MVINTFKYRVSCTDEKISVRIKLELLFSLRPIQQLFSFQQAFRRYHDIFNSVY